MIYVDMDRYRLAWTLDMHIIVTSINILDKKIFCDTEAIYFFLAWF